MGSVHYHDWPFHSPPFYRFEMTDDAKSEKPQKPHNNSVRARCCVLYRYLAFCSLLHQLCMRKVRKFSSSRRLDSTLKIEYINHAREAS